MIKTLHKAHSKALVVLLSIMTIFSFSLSVIRVLWSNQYEYLFLNWNLFLAFIPLFVSSYIAANKELQFKKRYLSILLIIWISFFPNAPYILTDLFHLRNRVGVPIWFDLLLILSFAWTGLSFWIISLMQIESLLLKFFKQRIVSALICVIMFACSFGVYLGRFLRWNTWDIITNPVSLNSQPSNTI